jgi:hypothetical protein
MSKITLLLSDDLLAMADEAAFAREMDRSTWIRQAIKAYVRTHKKSAGSRDRESLWASGYPKSSTCFHCKTACHDPGEAHGYLPEEITEKDKAWGRKHPCRG